MDFIFYPELPPAKKGIILELKVDHSPQEAIDQIKERNYVLRFAGNTGQSGRTPRGILLVGIGYDSVRQCWKKKSWPRKRTGRLRSDADSSGAEPES